MINQFIKEQNDTESRYGDISFIVSISHVKLQEKDEITSQSKEKDRRNNIFGALSDNLNKTAD